MGLRLWGTGVLATVLSLTLFSSPSPGLFGRSKKVLFLNSYHVGYPWSDAIAAGIRSIFDKRRDQYDLYVEYMDARRHAGQEYFDSLFALYRAKYRDEPPALIICSDDSALDFLLTYRSRLFPGVPVVFCGTNAFTPERLRGQKKITGIVEDNAIKENIALILKLRPETQTIAVVAGSCVTAHEIVKHFREEARSFVDRVRFLYLNDLTTAELMSALEALPPRTVVLNCLFQRDKDGVNYAIEPADRLISSRCRVPVFCLFKQSVTRSLMVGGFMLDDRAYGERVARLALNVLGGADIDAIRVDRSIYNQYIFDYRQLKKWGIPFSALPAGSVIINRPAGFYERHRGVLLPSVTIIAVLSLFSLALCVLLYQRHKSQRALVDRERQLKTIYDSISDAIIIYDPEQGLVVEGNHRAMELFRYGTNAFGALSWNDLIHPDDLPRFRDFSLASREGRSSRLEIRGLNREGALIDLELFVSRFLFHGVPRCLASARDIGERKKVERALRESEERVRALLNSTAEAICGLDLNYACVFANRSCLEALRVTEKDLLGKDIRLYLSAPERGDAMIDATAVAPAESMGEAAPLHLDEALARRGDGRSFFAEVWLYPVTRDNRRTGFVLSFLDISEKKKLHERLTRALGQLETIINNGLVGICLLENNRFARVNDKFTEMLRTRREDLLNRDVFEFFADRPSRGIVERLHELLLKNGVARLEANVPSLQGKEMWCSFSGQAIDPNRPEKGSTWLLEDIAERKQVEGKLRDAMEELRRSNEDLAQFAYVASHDLQEPLRAIAGYLQLIDRRYREKLDADGQRFIGRAVESAGRMSALINDLLDYSRVETRKNPMEPCELEKIAHRAAENLRAAIHAENAVVAIGPMPKLKVDLVQMTRLFQNLIGNAIKFHRANAAPRVEVSAERRGEQWVFSVRDNGIGIDADHHDRIFVIFQRLHTSREYPGTGIGLAICKKIVERHGGKIWVESKRDEGATFYFSLPLSES